MVAKIEVIPFCRLQENPKLSPGEYYEMSIEIVLSESTSTSNVGIFQAVVELVDQLNIKRTFRRSCFANRQHGMIYRIGRGWWNLVGDLLNKAQELAHTG